MARVVPLNVYSGTADEVAAVPVQEGNLFFVEDTNSVVLDVGQGAAASRNSATGPTGATGATGADGKDGAPGKDGADGAPGTPATVTVGDTTTGEPGTPATVTNTGTESAAVFNFTIPRGEDGTADKRQRAQGMVFLGDSNTANPMDTSIISTITSDDSGNVTIVFSSDSDIQVGDKATVINVTPLEFNGRFFVASKPSANTIVVQNPKAPANTTGASDWRDIAMVVLRQYRTVNSYIYIGAAASGLDVPVSDVFALSSTNLGQWGDRVDTYVTPTGAGWAHILLGTNDVGAGTAGVMSRYTALIDRLLLRGFKVLAGTIPPRNEDIAAERNVTILEVNSQLKDYCAKRDGVLVVDYYTALVDPDGIPVPAYFADTVHFSVDGHRAMGAALAGVLRENLLGDGILPISRTEDIASGTNMLDDPLIAKAPVTSTNSNVTGQYGQEVAVSIASGTAVSSVSPREDGYGNNVKANVTATGTSTAKVTFTATSSQSITAGEDMAVIPLFDLVVDGEELAAVGGTWSTTKNGAVRALTAIPASLAARHFVGRGEPIWLKTGDTLTNVSVAVTVEGKKSFTAEVGRVMIRLMPYDEYMATQTRVHEIEIPVASNAVVGGVLAKAKTTETNEVAIGPDKRLYAQAAPASQVAWGAITGQIAAQSDLTAYIATEISTALGVVENGYY